MRTVESHAGAWFQGGVPCESGEVAVGGGYKMPAVALHPDDTHDVPSLSVVTSMPSFRSLSSAPDGSSPTGWYFELVRNFESDSDGVTLYVLCAATAHEDAG